MLMNLGASGDIRYTDPQYGRRAYSFSSLWLDELYYTIIIYPINNR